MRTTVAIQAFARLQVVTCATAAAMATASLDQNRGRRGGPATASRDQRLSLVVTHNPTVRLIGKLERELLMDKAHMRLGQKV